MQIMFWPVYTAELYISQPQYQKDQWPQALKLTYLRDIKKQELIDATEDQWQHIKLNHQQQKQWLQQLADIWPDIKQNDQLTLFVSNDGSSQFYANGSLIGKIDDTEFGSAFLAIWLSERTSEPSLRKQLLGIKQ